MSISSQTPTSPMALIEYQSAQSVFRKYCDRKYCNTSILLKHQQSHWMRRTQYYIDQLTPSIEQEIFPRIVLSQTDPIEFLASFIATCIVECPVFLGNPNWSPLEWQQALDLIQPHRIWGTVPVPIQLKPIQLKPLTSDPTNQKGWIMIPTGGSAGQIKFTIHTWNTLTESVQGFQQFFGTESIHSCCVLPLYHVGGLMQFMRSLLTQGQFRSLTFAELISGESTQAENTAFLRDDSIEPQPFFLSLVPTQLQRLLQHKHRIPWLQQFAAILLGGAPPWAALLEQARDHRLNLAPTYGMTETAAQVATLKPHEFLNGNPSTGRILPHTQLQIVDSLGNLSKPHQTGQITLQAQSLFKGYYPDYTAIEKFATDDMGYLDEQGYLHVVGRSSRKIISGGENIFSEDVETALRGTGLVNDVYVIGAVDQQWGEAVLAFYVPSSTKTTPALLKDKLEDCLSHFKHPKYWIVLDELPRNPQGKVDQSQLEQMAAQYSLDLVKVRQ